MALVAAPLWAFFHIRMDGQEFVDQVQRPGYMIAFNLILRPVLMIFGLMLGYLVFGSMLWFVNYTFLPVSASLGQTSSVGIVGAVVLIILMSYLDFQIAMRSFHLITEIPERVSRWFGQGGENLSDDKEGQGASQFFVGGLERRIQNVSQGVAQAQRPKGRGANLVGTTDPGGRATTPAAGSPGSAVNTKTNGD